MFFDEEMLLDLRLNIMDKYVDKFVITEATYMHSGRPKKLLFDINKFSKFKDKIIYNIVDSQPPNIETIFESDNDDVDTRGQKLVRNSNRREHYQREMAQKSLNEAEPDDLILINDVDEIPNLKDVNLKKIKEKEHTENKSSKIRVRALLGNTSGKTSTSNSSLSLIWENYGLGFNQMSFKTTSSKNNVYEMKNSSLDLSYTIGEDWILTAGAGYVYGGKGSITSASTAIKYETESVSGFGLFGLLGIEWDGLEGLIGVRYYRSNYTEFNSTNTSEVLSLGKPYPISGAQLIFGLGYSF